MNSCCTTWYSYYARLLSYVTDSVKHRRACSVEWSRKAGPPVSTSPGCNRSPLHAATQQPSDSGRERFSFKPKKPQKAKSASL